MKTEFTVSEFVRLFNINRQTRHFDDQKGLFQPEFPDPDTHYRQYSHNQISQFSFITYLRTIGSSIEQIKQILQCGDVDYTMEQLHRQGGGYEKVFGAYVGFDDTVGEYEDRAGHTEAGRYL